MASSCRRTRDGVDRLVIVRKTSAAAGRADCDDLIRVSRTFPWISAQIKALHAKLDVLI